MLYSNYKGTIMRYNNKDNNYANEDGDHDFYGSNLTKAQVAKLTQVYKINIEHLTNSILAV